MFEFFLNIHEHNGVKFVSQPIELTGKIRVTHVDRHTNCAVEVKYKKTEVKVSGTSFWKPSDTTTETYEVLDWVNADDIYCRYVEELNLV